MSLIAKIILFAFMAVVVAIYMISLFAGLSGLLISWGVIKIVSDIFAGVLTLGLVVGWVVAMILAP